MLWQRHHMVNKYKMDGAKYEFRKDRLDLVGGFFSDSVSTCFCSDGRKQFILNIFKCYTKLALAIAWLHFFRPPSHQEHCNVASRSQKNLQMYVHVFWHKFVNITMWQHSRKIGAGTKVGPDQLGSRTSDRMKNGFLSQNYWRLLRFH